MTENPAALQLLQNLDPATVGLAVLAVRGEAGGDPATLQQRAALAPLRSQWAAEAEAVKRAGAVAAAARAAFDTVATKVEEARETASHISALEREAAEKAEIAGRSMAASYATGQRTAEAEAADTAAREAAAAVAAAKAQAGESLSAAIHGDELLAAGRDAMHEADRSLAIALHAYFERRQKVIREHLASLGVLVVQPLLDTMEKDRVACRYLTGEEPEGSRPVRLAARDGFLIRGPGFADNDSARRTMDAIRRAAGVSPDWQFRQREEERAPRAADPGALPPRPSPWPGLSV